MQIHYPWKNFGNELLAYCGNSITDDFSHNEKDITCPKCNDYIKDQYTQENILKRFKTEKSSIFRNYPEDTYGVWNLLADCHGESPIPTFLGYFEGTLEQALSHAASIKEFCTHHKSSGGIIIKLNITKL